MTRIREWTETEWRVLLGIPGSDTVTKADMVVSEKPGGKGRGTLPEFERTLVVTTTECPDRS